MRRHGALALVIGVIVSLLAAASATTSAAAAEPAKYLYYGQAGGSQVAIAGKVVRHDRTGASKVTGGYVPNNDSNRVARANVLDGVAKLGVVNTWSRARNVHRGTKVVSGGRTADLSLLGGLITADAVESRNVAVRKSTGMRSNGTTTFVNLTIGNQEIPLRVGKNTEVRIPGVARVILNGHFSKRVSRGMYSYGFGLFAMLLKPVRDLPAGATVLLNPTAAIATVVPPPGAPLLGGHAHGSRITADAGVLGAEAGPTGRVQLPPNGTYGQVLENATAQVDIATGPLSEVLHVDAIKSWASGDAIAGSGRAMTRNRITGLRVLNRTITADAIKIKAVTIKRPGQNHERRFVTEFVNLEVLGEEIDLNVSPNTRIEIANLGVLRINTQRKTKYGAKAIGLRLRLTTERYGLPIGATLEIGVAENFVYPR